MGTIVDITQYKLDQALASEETAAKIKLRKLSQANLIEHVKNIPYMVTRGPKIASSKFHLPAEQKELNVSPKKYIQMISGNYKPINVKEDKIENIRRNSDILISNATEKKEVEQTASIQPSITEETKVTEQEAVQNDSQNISSVDENVSSKNDSVTDISEYVARLNNEAQLVKNVKEEADLAQQEALASDENVNKLSVEVSELEKQEAAAEKQSDELNRQVIEAYENQTRTLALVRKEYENLIEQANERKQSNNDKIVQFQSRIDDIREHLTDVNESIARKQEILAALQQTEFSDINNIDQFPNTDGITQFENNSEEKIKRIA